MLRLAGNQRQDEGHRGRRQQREPGGIQATVTLAAAVWKQPRAQGGQSRADWHVDVLNERYDLLGWNPAYAVPWPGVTGARPGERNILWLNFTYPECCHPYVSRHEQLATLVAQFRGSYGRHVGEPAWTGFIRSLQAVSPHFARLWAEHDVASPVTYLKIFRHPAYPRLAMTTTSLGVLSVPGTRLVACTPADEACRTAIGKLLAGEGTGAHYPCWEAHQQRRADLAAAAASA